jgi:hypothetical protein
MRRGCHYLVLENLIFALFQPLASFDISQALGLILSLGSHRKWSLQLAVANQLFEQSRGSATSSESCLQHVFERPVAFAPREILFGGPLSLVHVIL